MNSPPRVALHLAGLPCAAAAVALLAAVAGAACSRAKQDPVLALVREMESAAEARDADRFLARLPDAVRGSGDVGRADVQAELRRYFAA